MTDRNNNPPLPHTASSVPPTVQVSGPTPLASPMENSRGRYAPVADPQGVAQHDPDVLVDETSTSSGSSSQSAGSALLSGRSQQHSASSSSQHLPQQRQSRPTSSSAAAAAAAMVASPPTRPPRQRKGTAGSSFANHPPPVNKNPRWAVESNRHSYMSAESSLPDTAQISYKIAPADQDLIYDKSHPEPDDYLHDPDIKKNGGSGFNLFSRRGCANFCVLTLLFLGIMMLFAGYPILSFFLKKRESDKMGFNIGGTNGTGQVPEFTSLFSLVDADTPSSAQTWTHPVDKSKYHIVFSDEFETEGRTFWPGDDPFWEAVDIWYGVTGDLEWYSPEAVNTTNGFLQITMEQKITHNLWFQSGMVQSWNKFCFQGGYIEMAAILPGSPDTDGWWPGLWTMGNLGRPGYPGSTDGMWPYSYDGCDTGILPNQTWLNGTGPEQAIDSKASFAKKGQLSTLPGMRTPSCTCANADHPGPSNNVARSSPELDILEAQTTSGTGFASQSLQTAPFDALYAWGNSSDVATIYNDSITKFNSYTGGPYQEAISGLTEIPVDAYELATTPRAVRFGAQYTPDWDGNGSGSVTWFIDGKPTWTVTGASIGPNTGTDIGQRLIPVEPMSIIMNLGMSNGFETIHYDTLQFPATLRVDYVRVYQPDGQEDRITCDPPDHPTANYISKFSELYQNPNLTEFPKDKWNWPGNSLTGC